MKKLIYLILIVCSFSAKAQTYAAFVVKADSCYDAKNYKMSVIYYEKAFKIEHKKEGDLYNAGCSAAQANENDKAFKWLNLAVDNGYDGIAHIKIDQDLTTLHETKKWNDLLIKLQKKLDIVEKDYDKPLQKELLDIYADDQGIRGDFMKIYKTNKTNKKVIDSIGKIMNYRDSINLIKVMKILDERGWVGKDVVGSEANQTLFWVIQHADLKYQQKYLPMMREAVKKGNASSGNLAYLEDRVALREGRRQIYGSQLSMPTDKKPYVYPLEDPDNVDKRRAEVGLGPLAEYAIKGGVVWNVEAYKKDLPELEKMLNEKKNKK